MQYAALIYVTPGSYDGMSEEQRRAITEEYFDIRDHPSCIGGAQLESVETASTVRVADDETLITDGPFANTKEIFGGFFLFEADDVDAVLELAARCPAARMGGAIEVRPLVATPRAVEERS